MPVNQSRPGNRVGPEPFENLVIGGVIMSVRIEQKKNLRENSSSLTDSVTTRCQALIEKLTKTQFDEARISVPHYVAAMKFSKYQ